MWLYQEREFVESDIGTAFGFVYQITNLESGRIYVGKKQFTFTRRKSIKGKKKKVQISSDWLDYWSSSDELKEDVAKLGKEKFKREILRLCYSKTECSYYEAHYQFEKRVLIEDTYNKWISCRCRRNSKLS